MLGSDGIDTEKGLGNVIQALNLQSEKMLGRERPILFADSPGSKQIFTVDPGYRPLVESLGNHSRGIILSRVIISIPLGDSGFKSQSRIIVKVKAAIIPIAFEVCHLLEFLVLYAPYWVLAEISNGRIQILIQKFQSLFVCQLLWGILGERQLERHCKLRKISFRRMSQTKNPH